MIIVALSSFSISAVYDHNYILCFRKNYARYYNKPYSIVDIINSETTIKGDELNNYVDTEGMEIND